MKSRYLALPDGQRIAIGADGDFDFPNGSVLVKNFRIGTQPVETRLFMRHDNGEWAGYTYEWNAQGTDATRVVGGKSVQVAGQSWLFPSELQCMLCHTNATPPEAHARCRLGGCKSARHNHTHAAAAQHMLQQTVVSVPCRS